MTGRIFRHRLFWPVAILILLLLSNLFFTPDLLLDRG